MKYVLMIGLCVWFLAACAPASSPTPAIAPTPTPTITPVPSSGTAADLILTTAEVEKAKQALGEKGFLGLVACNLSNEYHATVSKSAQQIADQYSLPLEIFDSQSKTEQAVSAISNFEVKGSKAIAVCSLDPKVLKKAVTEAAANGVIMLQYAGRDLPANGASISIDDREVGCLAGQIAGRLIMQEKNGQANVAILDYPELPNIVERANQIEACLKQAAPQANVVGRYKGGIADFGIASMESALQAHPEIDVVVSINDAGAYGAIKALEAAGKDPLKTIVIGIDGEKQAKNLIQQAHFFRGTVDTAPEKTGEMVLQAAIKRLAGSSIPNIISVPVKPYPEGILN